MSSLTTAQQHKMCLFHLEIEEVPLPVAQAELQTPPYPTAECSNIQPVTRLWPGYKTPEFHAEQLADSVQKLRRQLFAISAIHLWLHDIQLQVSTLITIV